MINIMVDEHEKILSLMGRMGLIVDTNTRESKFKTDMSPSLEQIIEEGIYKSYTAEDIYRILSKHYDIGYEKTFKEENKKIGIGFDGYKVDDKYGTTEVSVIVLFVPNDFNDSENIKKFFETCGWKFASSFQSTFEGYIGMQFEKNRQEDEIKVPNFLYHLTPTNKIPKILKNGLTPHAGNKKSDHIERIYFLQHKPNRIQCKLFSHELWQAGVEKELFLKSKTYDDVKQMTRDIKYSLLEIDVTKCNSNIKFYGDPNADGAVWTFDNIPPQAIKITNDNI